MFALPLGILLVLLGVAAVSLLLGIVYNWYIAVLAAPAILVLFAIGLLSPWRRRRD